jgi:hypothetical protein
MFHEHRFRFIEGRRPGFFLNRLPPVIVDFEDREGPIDPWVVQQLVTIGCLDKSRTRQEQDCEHCTSKTMLT